MSYYPHYPNVNIDHIYKYEGQYNHDEQYSLLCSGITGRLVKGTKLKYSSNSEYQNVTHKLGITRDDIDDLEILNNIPNKSVVIMAGSKFLVKETKIISGFTKPVKINLYLQEDDSIEV